MVYQSEEEQVEALKKWWRENGTSIVAGLVLAVGGIMGWQAWQKHQFEQRVAASAAYQQLGEAWSRLAADEEHAGKVESTFKHLAETLQNEHADTVYAHLGSLQLARFEVDHDRLAEARTALNWVLEHKPPSQIAETARLRLAQVQLAEGDAEGALAALEKEPAELLVAEWEELRGDVLMVLKRREDAVAAYKHANDVASAQGQRRPLLELKLDDVGMPAEDS